MRSSFTTLPDYLRTGLDLVLVGINPGIDSVRRAYCFSSPYGRDEPAYGAAPPVTTGRGGGSAAISSDARNRRPAWGSVTVPTTRRKRAPPRPSAATRARAGLLLLDEEEAAARARRVRRVGLETPDQPQALRSGRQARQQRLAIELDGDVRLPVLVGVAVLRGEVD